MATRPPLLTKKRIAWATPRLGHTFRGTTLNYNAGVQDKYVKQLQALVKQMAAQVTREYAKLARSFGDEPGTAMDADPASQARIISNKLTVKFEALFGRKAKALAERMVKASEATSKSTLHMSLKELSGGLSLKTDLLTSGLKTILTATVAENVSLIKSIPTQYMRDVAGTVFRAIQTGEGLADIVPKLAEYEGVTLRRARNIALDQTRKTYNSINRERMTAVGIKKFEWIHSGGGQHPREDHIEMDGNVYSFDDLPIIDKRTGEHGIPGQAINCKCTMRPVVDFGEGETE